MDKLSIQVGPGIFSLLTILFIALKLTGTIAWSWLWVLAPLWLPLVALVCVTVVTGISYLIYHLLSG